MSSSSATGAGSRSSSPATPEASDSPEPLVVRDDADFTSWRDSLSNGTSITSWEGDTGMYSNAGKREDERMLSLNDLIHNHAYDDPSMLSGIDMSGVHQIGISTVSSSLSPSLSSSTPPQSIQFSDLITPMCAPVSLTKPVPPPVPLSRKRDVSAASDRVVYPPKESCYNLPIITPSIPEGGTKSRVETQVRVTVDLAYASSSSGEPFTYDKIGTWKWLQLPKGTSTKKRTRKEGKIDPSPEDILHLSVAVTCATPPQSRVVSCSSCRTREAKRIARKIAARVRPIRSDSDSPDGQSGQTKYEDTSSVVQFNCPEVLDFSSGSTILPMRITCYCRHHREKVGFHVHLTMADHTGRIVGTGTTHPIMITDDHKSSVANKQGGGFESNADWEQLGLVSDSGVPKRKYTAGRDGSSQAKKRARATESPQGVSSNVSRTGSVGDLASLSAIMTESYGASSVPQYMASGPSSQTLQSPHFFPGSDASESEAYLPSPSHSRTSTNDHLSELFSRADATSGNPSAPGVDATSPPNFLPTAPPSPVSPTTTQLQAASVLPSNQPIPFMFNFNPDPGSSLSTFPSPKIHRLIPSSGPTYGGIEVTVLGANFYPSVQLNCVFGDMIASSTQRWSDNTLVCVLPPRVSAGVVAVWFDGLEKDHSTPPCMFTYVDESDRALMELALQVVGLKMTGKLEDAKNVAMRIVGGAGSDDTQSMDTSNMMQIASLSTRTTSGVRDFEGLILNFLSLLDTSHDQHRDISTSSVISQQTPSGQTLLHLAVILKFPALVKFLIEHDIDLDVRDRNGFTASHFAAAATSKECLRLLVDAGAALDIVNVLGETPEEVAPPDLFDDLYSESDSDRDWPQPQTKEDEEATWGDAEEDSEDEPLSVAKGMSRRSMRRSENGPTEERTSARIRPSVPSEDKKKSAEQDNVDEKQAASLVNMIQRTLAQFQPAQGIIPNMPHIPGMPAVPWAALPLLPVVFPAYMHIPGLPTFLTDKRGEQDSDKERRNLPTSAPSAHEWRVFLERWMKLDPSRAEVDENPPPAYTPREMDEATDNKLDSENSSEARSTGPLPSSSERAPARRLRRDSVPVVVQEVKTHTYKTLPRQEQKGNQKHDRMLIMFWIPMLFFGFMWVFFTAMRITIHILRATLPIKSGMRFLGV